MVVYFASHYNLSRFREPITKDDYNIYNHIMKWFQTNPESRGTISMNSLFIQSHFWENESLLRDISKLCLSGHIDLSSSMYSNYIPFNFPHEDKFIEFQIRNAASILRDTYPKEQVLGYYPPFGVWDERSAKYLESEGFKYVIMDWYILEKAISDNPQANIDPSFSRPFKIKGYDLYTLPSFDLRSIYRIYPEIYKEFLQSGEIKKLLKIINEGANQLEEIDEDFFGLLSLNINDLKFPIFRSDFDFDRYLIESEVLANQPLIFTKPSDMIEKVKDIDEIDIKSSLPFEILSLLGMKEEIQITPCCIYIVNIFKKYLNKLLEYQSKIESLSDSLKGKITNLLDYAWNYLITMQHNYCFTTFSLPIKGINSIKVSNRWKSIHHLEIVRYIIDKMLEEEETQQSNQMIFIGEGCDELAFVGENLFCSFIHKGGILCNLVNLKTGEFIASTPSQHLAIDQISLEPRFGMMYDIVSKRYSGQYNLFNEGYTFSQNTGSKNNEICLSTYATGDIILEKYFQLEQKSNTIKIKYHFVNRGGRAEEFVLYSLSKINLGDFQNTLTLHDDFDIKNHSEKNNKSIIILSTKNAQTSLRLELPEEISWRIVRSFGSLDLTLRMDVPKIPIEGSKEFSFSLIVE